MWVGTRFVASDEAGCSQMQKEAVVQADWGDTTRTLVISGRPLRVRRNGYIAAWEGQEERVKDLTEKGIIPMNQDLDDGKDVDLPFFMGQVSALITDIKPAQRIVHDMVKEAEEMLRLAQHYVVNPPARGGSKL